MDASNVMPNPMIRPVIVSRLRVKPKIDIDMRVSIIEMGIENPIITVAFTLRKKNIRISMARAAP